jgi:predicted ATPase/DNA-binding SARP family transcriptional activator
VELRLLGPLEIVDDDGDAVELRGDKPKGLVTLLGLRAGEVVSTARIVEELWGDREIRDPLNAVQVVVSKLRRALGTACGEGRQVLATTGSGYRLDVVPEAVDTVRFERLAAEGRRLLDDGMPEPAAEVLREALGLWRGPALEDFDDDFARGDRTRLEELRAAALELRIDADLALGRHEQVAAELATLVVEHPLRERLRGQQMLALYRSGRQGEALRAYRAARTTLADELGLDPGPDLQRLEEAILARDPALDLDTTALPAAAPTSRSATVGNLPAPISSFVGRAEEIDTVAELVRDRRLVTLVGPGGVGKTRLALQAATGLAGHYPDGVWLIELASLHDPLHVAAAVATALNLDDAARLEPFLADKRVLLVVDNCEHVIDEAARVVERVLRAGAEVRVLATSREGLGVAGEIRWTVAPLPLAEASTLFHERARAGGGDDTGVDDGALVERICDRLDGLPLAVELAAARTRSLSLTDIVARIDDRFGLLTTGGRTMEPRQQTLRRVVDWSYDLLSGEEQRVFRRLSVFAGGFDLAAAEAVAAGDDVAAGDVIDILGQLVDKSLVSVTDREDGTRYGLLQTLVDYGRERLRQAGDAEATGDRHLAWMVEFAAAAEPGLRGPDQPRWIRRLGRELDNGRVALRWAEHRGQAAAAVAMAAGLAYGWYITGAVADGQTFIVRALAMDGHSSAEHRAVAGAWGAWLIQIGSGAAASKANDYAEQALVAGRCDGVRGFATAAQVTSLLRAYRGHTFEANELIEEAAVALVDHPDPWQQAFVDWVRSGLALKMGDAARAEELLRASVARFAAEGDRYGQAIASIRLGELAELRGDYDEAVALTTFAYEATTNTGPGANASILATRLGNLAANQGAFEDARTWHHTALSRARELGFPGPAAQALSGMAVAAGMQGGLDQAERLHREALAAYEAVGSVEGAAFTETCLGLLATQRGDAQAALELHRRSLAKAALGGDRRAIVLAIEGSAGAHALAGNAVEAARMLGVAAELLGDSIAPPPWFLAERSRVETAIRSQLGDTRYADAYRSGREQADTIAPELITDAQHEPGDT